MSDDLDRPVEEYDPSTMAISSLTNRRITWYRRPWFLISVLLVIVVAISVATDLPHPITVREDISDQNAVLTQMASDAKECAYGVRESYNLYRRFVTGSLSASQLATTKTYVTEDEVPCSFAGEPVYDLTNNIQITLTAAGHHVDSAHTALDHWISGTALMAIQDIRTLLDTPGNQAVLRNLQYQTRSLNLERQHVLNDIAQAGQILGTTLVAPTLPEVNLPAG